MFEYACLSGKAMKKSKKVIRVLDILHRLLITFWEEGEDNDWTRAQGGFLGCWVLDHTHEGYTFLTNDCYTVCFVQFSI